MDEEVKPPVDVFTSVPPPNLSTTDLEAVESIKTSIGSVSKSVANLNDSVELNGSTVTADEIDDLPTEVDTSSDQEISSITEDFDPDFDPETHPEYGPAYKEGFDKSKLDSYEKTEGVNAAKNPETVTKPKVSDSTTSSVPDRKKTELESKSSSAPTSVPERTAAVDSKPQTPTVVSKDKNNVNLVIDALTSQGLTDPKLQIAVLANIEKETKWKITSEDLSYSSIERLRKVFPSKTKNLSDDELSAYVKNPEALAELVYGGSNGNTQKGDGFKYRGRGFIQLTGKANYAAASKALGIDLVSNPDLAIQPDVAAKVTAWFITRGLKKTKFETQEEANISVTQAIGGAGLNLNSGIGKELLSKVASNAKNYESAVQVAQATPKTPTTVASSSTSTPSSATSSASAPAPIKEKDLEVAQKSPARNEEKPASSTPNSDPSLQIAKSKNKIVSVT